MPSDILEDLSLEERLALWRDASWEERLELVVKRPAKEWLRDRLMTFLSEKEVSLFIQRFEKLNYGTRGFPKVRYLVELNENSLNSRLELECMLVDKLGKSYINALHPISELWDEMQPHLKKARKEVPGFRSYCKKLEAAKESKKKKKRSEKVSSHSMYKSSSSKRECSLRKMSVTKGSHKPLSTIPEESFGVDASDGESSRHEGLSP